MIDLLFAAALMVDATPKPAAPFVEASRTAAVPSKVQEMPVLAGVAVTLECTAHVTGRVSDCRVLGETHPGLGFGEAAIALMNGAEVTAPTRDTQFAHTIQFTPSRGE